MQNKISRLKTPAAFDFLNSLMKTLPFSFLCALSLLFSFFFSSLDVLSKQKIDYQMFFGESSISILTYTQYVLMAAGFCTALILFRFLGSTPQTNLVMSFGISRERLFKNRCLAGVTGLFLGVFLPLTAVLFLNIRAYGLKSYMLKPYFLYLLSALVVVLVGFAIGLIASVLAGSTAEAAAMGAVLPSFPYVLITLINTCVNVFLKGYVGSYEWTHTDYFYKTYFLSPLHLLFNPESLTLNISQGSIWQTYSKISAYSGNEKINPYTALKIPSSLFTVFVVWLAVIGLIVLLSYFFFLKRKAERNSHLRSSKAVAAVLTSFFVTGAAALGIDTVFDYYTSGGLTVYFTADYKLKAMYWGALLLPGVVAIIICLAIYAGSLKRFRALLKLTPLCFLLTVIPLICLLGGFGYVSKIPDAADIESVTIAGFMMKDALENIGQTTFVLESSRDKQTITAIHEQLIDNTYAEKLPSIGGITYTLKDGKKMKRVYYTDAGALNVLFDSDAVESYLYNQIGDKTSWRADGTYPREISWLRFGGASIILSEGESNASKTRLNPLLTEESFDRLLKCFAEDLVALTAAEYYTPSQLPVYKLSFDDNSVIYSEYGDEIKMKYEFYITKPMTKTLKFLSNLEVTGGTP